MTDELLYVYVMRANAKKFIIKLKTKDSDFHTLLPRQKASCTGLTGDTPAWHFSRPSAPPSGEEKKEKKSLNVQFSAVRKYADTQKYNTDFCLN